MGAEAALVPLVVSALGTGAAVYETDRTAKNQDRAAAAGIRQQAGRQREADARIAQEIEQIEGSSATADRERANASFMEQLQRNRAVASGSIPKVAGASGRYAEDVESRTGESDALASRVAGLMSRIEAPGMQRLREGQQFGRLASDIGQIGRASAGDDFLTRLRMRSIRANPWVMAGSQMAQNYGGYLADSAGSGAGTERVLSSGQRIDAPARRVNTRGLS